LPLSKLMYWHLGHLILISAMGPRAQETA
jgi:hypothetical protein